MPNTTSAAETLKPETVTPSFNEFSKLSHEDTSPFVKFGSAIMRAIRKAKEDTDEAKSQLKTLGLQFAVLGRLFFTKYMTEPSWFNKTVGDFIAHTYGLKDGERFPGQAWTNARVVLSVVVPEESVPAMLDEKHYLALSQSGLTVFGKIVLHKTITADGRTDRDNADLKEACAVCEAHADGYVKKLRTILARLDGEKETPADPVTAAFAMVNEAIAKAGDTDPEAAKALYFAVLATQDAWDKSGVDEATLDGWSKEWVDLKARHKLAQEQSAETQAEQQPAESVAAA